MEANSKDEFMFPGEKENGLTPSPHGGSAALRAQVGWNTDVTDFALAVSEFEAALPGFWWSVGQCSVGAHASCAVDGSGCQGDLLKGVKSGEPFDEGFHCDTQGGTPAEALRNVMRQAVEYLGARQ